MVHLVTLYGQSTEKAEAPGPLGLGCLVPDRAKCPASGVEPWVCQGKWALLSLFEQSPKTRTDSHHTWAPTHIILPPPLAHTLHIPSCLAFPLAIPPPPPLSVSPLAQKPKYLTPLHPTVLLVLSYWLLSSRSLPASKLPPDRYSATDLQTTTCPYLPMPLFTHRPNSQLFPPSTHAAMSTPGASSWDLGVSRGGGQEE